MTHKTGTREQWLAARIALLDAEKELTQRGDELARQRQELPWVRIDKPYRFETEEGSASLADLFRGRSQLLIYHFMFGPDYTAGCPSCSAIADGFSGSVAHLANHDVMLSAVSRAPLAKLQAYKRRMGWTFPWASSFGSDFNADFSVGFTEQQQREGGIEYNFRRERAWQLRGAEGPVGEMAAMTGTDPATYTRERPGMSAFVLEDGVVYHTYSTYARGLDGLWGMYQWLDRAPMGRNETGIWWRRHDEYKRLSRVVALFLGISALVFAVSASVTIAWCASMSAMQMPMPGGWIVTMAWMVMPGQTWLGAAASFLGMWIVMMVAMMLPSLAPMLWRYREIVATTDERRRGWLTTLVAVGYFFIWLLFGLAAFPVGIAVATIAMRHPSLARAEPIAAGAIVLIAGVFQFSASKAHHLACCREVPGRGRPLAADPGSAWRHGLHLGLHCSYCCAGLMSILLVIGVMDLRAMAVVTAAITIERLAPSGARTARAIGAAIVATAVFVIARAALLG